MASFFRRTIPSAALLVLGLVALLVVGVGGVAIAKMGGGGSSWAGASAAGGGSWGGAGSAGSTASSTIVAQVGGQVMFDSTVNATAQLPAGQTTFNVSTPDAAGHTLLLVHLADGLGISKFLADLTAVNSNNTAGQQDATSQVDNLGGAMVNSTCSVSFTESLAAGTYDLIDFNGTGISDAHPKVQVLQVNGTASTATPPTAASQIQLTDTNGRPRFVAPTSLPADGTFTVSNNTTNTNETAFLPLKPGTTAAALHKYFATFGSAGASWASAPFSGAACGLAPLNPGHQAVVHISTRPGAYVVASFALDPKTNKREATLGMYQQISFVTAS
jgi:hypothetical protein